MTLLIAGAPLEPAGAQDGACKADAVTAAGRGKFRPFTKTKELEGRGSAMADAVANWEREVGAKFGEQWKAWGKAKDTSFDCAPTKTGKIIGSSFIGCTIKGRPCSAPASAAAAKVGSDDNRGGRRDPDRGGRDRGGRDRGGDTAYDREMAHQDRLAAQRRREEEREYEREMARQKHLQAERDREEARAQKEEEARQRYFTQERRRYERLGY